MSTPILSAFIWAVVGLLRGDYKQSDYEKVILPFSVLRRLDCVLEATKPAVLAEKSVRKKAGLNPEPFLLRNAGQLFFNTSPLNLKKLMGAFNELDTSCKHGYVTPKLARSYSFKMRRSSSWSGPSSTLS